MKVLLALVTGYFVGANAGSRDYDQLVESVRAIRDSEEFHDFLTALRAHASQTLRELADMLERTGPEPPPTRTPRAPRALPVARPATARARVQKRRRDVMLVLGGAMFSTLLLSFVPGLRVMLVLHAIVDVLFVVYIALLIRLRGLSAEREMKLRFLPDARQQVEPALALRRSAN